MKFDRNLSSEPFFSSPAGSFFGAVLLGAVVVIFASILLIEPSKGIGLATLFGLSTYLAFSGWAVFRLRQSYPHKSVGLCNLVTLARLMIAGLFCVAIVAEIAPSWMTFALAALSLSLDGVDGWLARKQGLSSEFGAWFDVEVDAGFALLLAVFAAASGVASIYVVLLGLPYYAFNAAKRVLPWLDTRLPESLSRKAVCVFQIAVLIALQIPLFAPGQLDPLIALVACALLWSFGRDILWLRRAAHG